MPSTSGMKGDGFYDENSSGQRAAIESIAPWIEAAAAAAALPAADVPIVVADYGCSEGKNSILSTGLATRTLRQRGAKNPISAVFSDLPTNNFNQLFASLQEVSESAAEVGVFPAAVGASFYSPVCPPRSVHLGMSFTAVLWLDRLPAVPLNEFCVYLGERPHRADVVVRPEVAAAFQAQAATDMRRFYECRAAELAPGGRLLVVQPGATATHVTGRGLYDLLHDAALELIDRKKLDRAAYVRFTMPIYFRTVEELVAPIAERGDPLAEQFILEKSESQVVAMPFAADFAKTGDVDTYVEQYVGFAQAFTEPVLRAAIEEISGPDVVPEIFCRMKELLRRAPQKYEIHYVQVAALLSRR